MPHQARKRFGQHFLADRAILEKIVHHIAPKPADHILEIGPGFGALTHALMHHCKTMTLLELDRDIITHLAPTLPDHCTLLQGDAVHMPLPAAFDEAHSLRMVGNLSYNVATPILFRFLSHPAIIDIHIMVQKEVAERLAATPGSRTYGRASIMAQYYADVHYGFDVPPTAFSPPPKVDSAIVSLYPRPPLHRADDKACFARIVQKSFEKRRKMLRKIWQHLPDQAWLDTDIDPAKRPEQCSIKDFVTLANWVHGKKLSY
jgi:16S rRNA (adenine1518-N6/adenine1519-N6)-dimethyltransferase